MALGSVRLKGEFKSDEGVDYVVDIYDANHVGGYTSVTLGSDGFKLKYSGSGKERFDPIKASQVTFEVFEYSSAVGNVIDELATGEQGDFKVKITKDGSSFWNGILLTDVSSTKDESLPRSHQLRAVCGLSLMKKLDFNSKVFDGVNSTIDGLHTHLRILQYLLKFYITDDFYSGSQTFIRTSVNWFEDSHPAYAQNIDPMLYSATYPLAFQDVSDAGQTKNISAYDALKQLCLTWGARVFMADGEWYFQQYDAHKNMPVYYRRYNKNGTALGSGSVDWGVTTGTANGSADVIRLAGGSTEYYPKLRQVVATYGEWGNNWLRTQGFAIDNGTGAMGWNTSTNTFTLDHVESLSGSAISFYYDYMVDYFGATSSWSANWTWGIWVKMKIGNYYYTNAGWSTTSGTYTQAIGSVPSLNPHYGNINILTTQLPASGNLEVQVGFYCHDSSGNNQVYGTTNTDVLLYQNSTSHPDNGIKYTINGSVDVKRVFGSTDSSANDSNEKVDMGTLRIGDGPTTSARGRIRVSSDLVTWSLGKEDSWKAFNTGNSENITQLMVNEFLYGQKAFIKKHQRIYLVRAGESLNFYNAANEGLSVLSPNGWTLIAAKDEIRGEFYETKRDTSNVVLDPADISSSTLGQNNNTNQNVWFNL